MAYAEVAVNAPGAGRRPFTYAVPAHLGGLEPGHAVLVPFGRHTCQGIVVAVGEETALARVRPVQELVEPRPVVSPLLIGLAQWMSGRYLCDLYDAFLPMLPPAFDRRQRTVYSLAMRDTGGEDLPPLQSGALAYLEQHGPTPAEALREALRARNAGQALAALERAGLVRREVVWERPRVAARVEAFVSLATSPEEALAEAGRLREGGAFRQADALALLARLGRETALAEARRLSGAGTPSWDALVKRGLVRSEEREVRRDPLAGLQARRPPITGEALPTLTPHQQAAVNGLASALAEGRGGVFLLHGVTGSGKTEVYLRALEKALAVGKRGIVLVPEIALTPQTVQRFWERFPGRVAVLHSGLSLREQYDEWRSVQEGSFDVVIGSRRAVFAPQPDVGLIVIDEEQEWTYKQEEQTPRYHARDAAIELARRAGAVVVLGSATPDVGTMYEALRGVYTLHELPGRITASGKSDGPSYAEVPVAQVAVVDLRDELRAGNRSIFSRSLTAALAAALANGEQAILFVNRRGAGSSVQCRACGYAVRCRRCSVTMTYHADGSLVCHRCGRRQRSPQACPACGRTTIRPLGIGTERVAQEAQAAFPTARIGRWDRDSVRATAGGHEAILGAFLRHETDVLVGTQMLAKGLDLPRVTVVGVVNADIGLHVPDVRSAERTFQLLCQVAGRAGRGFAPGRAIIQTYEPDHYAIQAAAAQDYSQFYLQEIGYRQRLGYPPFARTARLLFAHTSAKETREEAERYGTLLRTEVRRRGLEATRIVGPAPAPIERLRGRYRWQVEVIAGDPTELLNAVPPPPRWVVDVDPVSGV